jgi:hypothetical protein
MGALATAGAAALAAGFLVFATAGRRAGFFTGLRATGFLAVFLAAGFFFGVFAGFLPALDAGFLAAFAFLAAFDGILRSFPCHP